MKRIGRNEKGNFFKSAKSFLNRTVSINDQKKSITGSAKETKKNKALNLSKF